MNDTHLESFITVADCGSISKAAKNLYISPQALSQQIELVEREYGHSFFERSTRGVTLTEAGRVFYAFAKQVLAEQWGVKEMLSRLAADRAGVVRIGSVAGPPSNLAMSAMYRFFQQHPDLRRETVGLHVMDRLAAVADDRVDVVEYAKTPAIAEMGLGFAQLGAAQLMVMASADSDLARKASATFDELAGRCVTVFDWDYYRAAIEAHPEVDFVQYEHNAPGFTDEFHREILEALDNGTIFLAVKGSEFYNGSADLFSIGLTLLAPEDTLTLGLAYRPDAPIVVREFVEFISSETNKG